MERPREYELRKVLRDVSVELASEKVGSLPEAAAVPAATKSEGLDGARFHGPGWEIELEQLSPIPVGIMTMERLEMTIHGDKETVTSLWDRLQYKFLRGGA